MTLADRFAEDERVARAATPGPWQHPHGCYFVEAVEGDHFRIVGLVDGSNYTPGVPAMANADHIARWSPERALAYCAVARLAVEMVQRVKALTKLCDDFELPAAWRLVDVSVKEQEAALAALEKTP